MATITKTIKPGGGGDYTSLASAIAGIAYTTGDTINFVCYAGDIGWDDITGLSAHVTVISDSGAKHNGKTSQSLTGVAHTSGGIYLLHVGAHTYTIDGLRIDPSGAHGIDIEMGSGDSNAFVIENNLIAGDVDGSYAILFLNTDGNNPLTVKNNVANITDSSQAGIFAFYFVVQSNAGTAVSDMIIEGNSISADPTSFVGEGIHVECTNNGGLSTVNVTCLDNYVGDTLIGFNKVNNGTALNVVSGGYNASTDSHATAFGVTGCLTGLDSSTLFVDPLTDLHLKSGSVLKAAGVVASGLTTDNQGRTRSSPPSIGAFEFVSGNAILGNGLM